MRAPEAWRPSVFRYRRNRWRTSLDVCQVEPASRIATQLAARSYAAAIARHARGDLVDLGCGSVPCYGMYREQVQSVTCIDWTATPHQRLHLDLMADLSKPLPLRDSLFDTVILTDVLEHLVYPDMLWQELSRVTRPGGAVIVGVPFMYWIHEQPHDYFRYTEYRLRRFCEDHGFAVVELSATGDARAVLLDVVLRGLAHYLPRGLMRLPSRLALSLVGRTDALPAMPIGYVLVARREPAPAG